MLRLLSCSLLVVVMSACGPQLQSFNVALFDDATVAAGNAFALDFAGLDDVDLDASAEFNDHDAGKADVTKARLLALNLTVQAPQGANLDWLDSVAVTAVSPDLDDVEVASAAGVDGRNAIVCDVADEDLAEFVRAGLMQLRVDSTGVPPPQDTTVRADFTFSVTVEK